MQVGDTVRVQGHGGVAWRIERITGDTQVICRMVGDDHDWMFDLSDLSPLAETEYCHDCGQTGCGWNVPGES